MDRLRLTLAGCGLAVIMTAPGCRSTRSEVPPPRPYAPNGQQMPPVGFGSDPRPVPNNALGPTMNDGPKSVGQLGTPAPGAGNFYGAPTNNSYGPPGTAGSIAPQQGSALQPSLGDTTLARPPMTQSPGGPALPPVGSLGQPGTAPIQ